MQKLFYVNIVLIVVTCFTLSSCSRQEKISLFPLDHYSQNISDWIHPGDKDYDRSLMTNEIQQKRLQTFYKHYDGALSPWNESYVKKIIELHAPDNIQSIERGIIIEFTNQNKSAREIGYAENFRPHTQQWIDDITSNINLSQFDSLHFDPRNQGIATTNLQARALPTDDVYFYSYKIAGEGYPFDNLQISALWAGTPVYILGETLDHAWSMVITPDYIGWVKSDGIARVSPSFINTWEQAASHQLIAITHTKTPIVDQQGIFRFLAYVGSVYPAQTTDKQFKIMIPVINENHTANIRYATLASSDAILMPLTPTQHHFADLMKTLIGRPYGWGNMYFYNDCSSELKSLFTPFGIWLPRHSSDQVMLGKHVDMTSGTPKERLNYLMENGRRFMTLIYVGNHIVLYIGNYPNPNARHHELMAMTYQAIWGLKPHPATRRAVIGQSVLLPMLLKYPEDRRLVSIAGRKYFQVAYLDETADELSRIELIDLRSLMSP